jgi:glycosyltransferase involved in cell wall biosynthesis/CDP-glycerol glycerophosphotransferase (TagB/SpsB family)
VTAIEPATSDESRRILFSLVISVYNVEEYLREFLDSVDTLVCDRERLELIFVDDGSPDDSAQIIQAWISEHNIAAKLLRKTNGGLSSARNHGMEQATGEWISFPDPDDVLSHDYLERISEFLDHDERADSVAMIVGHLVQFMHSPAEPIRPHPLDFKFSAPVRVVDLNESPKFVHLHSATGFYRLDAVRKSGLRFKEEVSPVFEDGVFTGEYMLCAERPVTAFLREATYFYRKRENQSSLTGTAWSKPGKYTSVFEAGYLGLFKRSGRPAPLWLQYIILYDLQWYLKTDERNQSETAAISPELTERFFVLLRETLSYIDDSAFFTYSATGVPIRMRLAFLSLKSGWIPRQEARVIKLDVAQRLMLIRYYTVSPEINEVLRVDGTPAKPVFSKVTSLTYFGHPWIYERDLWVSAVQQVALEIDGEPAKMALDVLRAPIYETRPDAVWNRFIRRPAPISPDSMSGVVPGSLSTPSGSTTSRSTASGSTGPGSIPTSVAGPVTATGAGAASAATTSARGVSPAVRRTRRPVRKRTLSARIAGLVVHPTRIPRAVRHLGLKAATRTQSKLAGAGASSVVIGLPLPSAGLPVPTNPSRVTARRMEALATSPDVVARYRKAWVLIDRDDQAQDNAEAFYRYLRRDQPQINAWFVLAKDSTDWARLEADGFRLVDHGSTEHVLLMKNAKYLISSQIDEYIVKPYDREAFGPGKWKYVFLQHGVTHNDLSRWINTKPIRLMITATEDEHNGITGDGSPYVFSDKEVALTGFPRHDRLLAKVSELTADERSTILVMPTWRDNLLTSSRVGNARQLIDGFEESDYARSWFGLLHSEELHVAAKAAGLKIAFAAHPNFQHHISASHLPPHVELIRYSDHDIQDVIARARIMVTDYSSLAFEAAYVKTPVVYFQFDRQDFFAGQHAFRRGSFSVEEDGFGPVVQTLDEAVSALVTMASGGQLPDETFRKRIEGTFAFRDGRCSERVYARIRAMESPVG